jgi:hypothetical protein
MSNPVNNYAVVSYAANEAAEVLEIAHSGLVDTKDAERWIVENGTDGADYHIVRIGRRISVRVESKRKLVVE